jgi:GMP synthase-like glutamine amidotransferase
MMRLLLFQHVTCEHPGSLRQLLKRENIQWDAVNLDQGDPIPELGKYDLLWVMGGPMDVWDVEEHPWLVAEKAAIRTWVLEFKKPYLGLCLGHQLLADALGGTCELLVPPEIGILNVNMTNDGKADPLFAGMPQTHKCLQWHSVEVTKPPENSTILQSSEACRIQAMRVGSNAWSMQYHLELEPDTVMTWNEIPAYRDALASTLGSKGLKSMQSGADQNMSEFLKCASIIFENFMALARQEAIELQPAAAM